MFTFNLVSLISFSCLFLSFFIMPRESNIEERSYNDNSGV